MKDMMTVDLLMGKDERPYKSARHQPYRQSSKQSWKNSVTGLCGSLTQPILSALGGLELIFS